MREIKYKDLEQQKLRDDFILKSLEKANMSGKKCRFSEEQIEIAQRQTAKEQINQIYSEEIFPIANNILYLIYTAATLFILPFLYVGGEGGTKVSILTFYALMGVCIIVLIVVEKQIKKRPLGDKKELKAFQKFSNDTFIINYMLTSIGYMMALIGSFTFWYIYLAICLTFFMAVYFDFVKPFMIWRKNRRREI